ncbi:MAG TPA: ABC transporter ATP-binding protein, partial [Fimbriimonas sp.]
MSRRRERELDQEAPELSPLKRLIPELKPFKGLLALCLFLTLSQSGFGLLPPIILGDIVNRLTKGEPINTYLYMGYIVGFALCQGLLVYGQAVAMSTLGQRFLLRTRDKMVAHMQSLPLAYFEKNQTGKLVSNVINDAATISGLITGNLTQMAGDFAQLVLVLVVLFTINPVLALISLSIAPIYIWNFRRYLRPLQSTSHFIRSKRDAMYGQMQEKLVGIQTVKGFGQERWEARSFMSTTRELMGLNIQQGRLGGGLWTFADAMCGVATAAVLWYGGM